MKQKKIISTAMTRSDKLHKKFIDKLNVLKDNVNHGYDSLKAVHKQTTDSAVNFKEAVDKGQEAERKALYDIIKNSADEGKFLWVKERIQELDRIKEKEVEGYNKFLEKEREKTDRNITGGMLMLAVSAGLISNKQVRQMGGKAIGFVGKSLLQLKK